MAWSTLDSVRDLTSQRMAYCEMLGQQTPIRRQTMMKHAVMTVQALVLALFLAVSKGDLSESQSLIEQGVHVDGRDEYGNSPLMIAARSPKNDKVTRLLLKAGAAVNSTNAVGETPLFAAARVGNESGVKLLLKHGADPNIRNCKGVTALMVAAEEGNPECVQALVEAGADVNTCDRNGETPLMAAAAMGNEAVVRVLLAAGADRLISTPYVWTALMFANALGQPNIAAMLQQDPVVHEGARPVPEDRGLAHEPLVASKYLSMVGIGGEHIPIEKGGASIPETTECGQPCGRF
jgi:ankyrin repeat protein